MAKTRPPEQRALKKSEPEARAESSAAPRVGLQPRGDGPPAVRKAPQARAARDQSAAKAPKIASKAADPATLAHDQKSPPATRRAERRTANEVRSAPARAERRSAPSAANGAKPPAAANRAKSPSGSKNQTSPAPSAAATPAASAAAPAASAQPALPDVEALARNIALAIEQGGKALAAYLRPRESGEIKATAADDIGEVVRSIGRVAEHYMADPQRAFQAQAALTRQFIDLWGSTLQRLQGEQAPPIAAPDAADKRFADPAWRDNPYFDFIKQAYVLTTRWADDLVKRADDLDPHERDKAQFYLRQVSAALSPSNFLATNPELLRTTIAESGENLARGLKMLAEDIEAGHGELRIRQSDARAFTFGVNMAATPGKVIFRNALIELIQYEPTTPQVYERPLLIVPPWINKYYVLDLNPEKSFVRWAVGQGLTVFVVSWVNPDERHADKDFDNYMREGILAALDAVEQATGEREVAAIGYCVGGTLLAATLAYMAAVGDQPDNERDFLRHPDRLHRRWRSQGVRRRRAIEGGRGKDGRTRLSRRLADGQRLQHAEAERAHLVVLRQQLFEG